MPQDQAKDLALLTAAVAGQGSGDEPPQRADQFLAKRRQRVAYGLLAPGAIYLTLAFIVPLILVVYTSLESGGLLSGGYSFSWAFDNYTSGLTEYKTFYMRVARLLGPGDGHLHPARLSDGLLDRVLRRQMEVHAVLPDPVPFFVSFVIRTVQWKFMLADDGLIFGPLKTIGLLPDTFHVLATPFAVVAGITYNFLPFTALPLYVALERIDKRLVEAAKDLYATKFEAFRKVVLPLSFPGLFAAVILTFVPATGDYVNSSVLGSNKTTMIGQIIQSKFLVEADYPEAAALSVILMIGMLVLALIYAKVLGTEDAALAAGAA